jgi:hypothetical protein
MGFKLGDISPIAGVLSGKGLMGKLAGSGGMGLLPAFIARDAQKQTAAEVLENAEIERKKEEAQLAEKKAAQLTETKAASTKMKRGGSVSSASKRADGIATKGKTRGRMC